MRNLPNYEKGKLALRLENIISKKNKENQIRKPESVMPKSAQQKESITTRDELAKIARVSHDTIRFARVIE